MNLTLTSHPTPAIDPDTRKILTDVAGVPLPAFPDQRAIRLDGVLIGYCGTKPQAPINLIRNYPTSVRDEIHKFVERELDGQRIVPNMPPPPQDERDVDEME